MTFRGCENQDKHLRRKQNQRTDGTKFIVLFTDTAKPTKRQSTVY